MKSPFFESLYNYLLGEFYFSKHGKDLGANTFYTTDPTGEEKEVLAFAENYSHVYLSKILQDLSLMKRFEDKKRLQKEKEWYESDEGKAFDRKIWEELMEELEKKEEEKK